MYPRLNNRICQHCGVKTSTVTPSFYYVFNVSLSCNINIPSFIGNLWWDLLLGNHLKFLCRRSVGFSSRAFLVFLTKESKKRRRRQPGKLMPKSRSQLVNLPGARSLMNPLPGGKRSHSAQWHMIRKRSDLLKLAQVCIRAKWPIRPDLILVSVA